MYIYYLVLETHAVDEGGFYIISVCLSIYLNPCVYVTYGFTYICIYIVYILPCP